MDGFSRSFKIRTHGRYLHIALRMHCVDKADIWLEVLFMVLSPLWKPVLSFANTSKDDLIIKSATNKGSKASRMDG